MGWVSLVIVPAAVWSGGREARLVGFAVGAYLAGWVFLAMGWKRDPNMERTGQYAHSRSACVAALAAGIAFQVVALAVGALAALVLLVACGAVFLGLWALNRTEAGLRAAMDRLLIMFFSLVFAAGTGEWILSLPPVTIHTLPPCFVRACRRAWERENYDRLWENNRQRFRSFHLEAPKDNGVFRIVTLGDSFTWGDKIASTQDTWPYVLERACVAKRPGVQVINLARPGFTTVNEEEMLNRFGWGFKPDLIVLQYFLNDPLPSGPGFQAQGEEWMQAPTWPLLPYLHRTLDRGSYLYSLLNQEFSSLQRRCLGLRNMTYADLFADDFTGWQESRRALQNMAKACPPKVPILLVLFPSFQNGLDEHSYPYLALHAKIMSAAAELGLPAVDLRPVYERIDPRGPSWWAISLDTHPGVRAHRVAGEAIAEEIKRRHFLPAHRPQMTPRKASGPKPHELP